MPSNLHGQEQSSFGYESQCREVKRQQGSVSEMPFFPPPTFSFLFLRVWEHLSQNRCRPALLHFLRPGGHPSLWDAARRRWRSPGVGPAQRRRQSGGYFLGEQTCGQPCGEILRSERGLNELESVGGSKTEGLTVSKNASLSPPPKKKMEGRKKSV